MFKNYTGFLSGSFIDEDTSLSHGVFSRIDTPKFEVGNLALFTIQGKCPLANALVILTRVLGS